MHRGGGGETCPLTLLCGKYRLKIQENRRHRVTRQGCRSSGQACDEGIRLESGAITVAVNIGACIGGAIRSLGNPWEGEVQAQEETPQDVSQKTDDERRARGQWPACCKRNTDASTRVEASFFVYRRPLRRTGAGGNGFPQWCGAARATAGDPVFRRCQWERRRGPRSRSHRTIGTIASKERRD